jgi:hypothetical protein
MSIPVGRLIDELNDDAGFFNETDESGARATALRLSLAAKTLTLFRGTLIAIAQNQGELPSHQAQNTLKTAGDCDHHTQVFHYEIKGSGEIVRDSNWVCGTCGRISCDRLVPYL